MTLFELSKLIRIGKKWKPDRYDVKCNLLRHTRPTRMARIIVLVGRTSSKDENVAKVTQKSAVITILDITCQKHDFFGDRSLRNGTALFIKLRFCVISIFFLEIINFLQVDDQI